MSFSERMGFVPERELQVKHMDNRLRNRLWNYYSKITECNLCGIDGFSVILDKMGERNHDLSYNKKLIDQMFLDESNWYVPYDIIEILLEYIKNKDPFDRAEIYRVLVNELNSILVEEKSGYRMIDGKFVPITDEMELNEIRCSMHSTFDSVNEHIKKALNHYSDREKPDYENSIKESISAVEAMCCIITESTGAKATLGSAIKKLKENGVHIHEAMEKAFSSLYGYTSDENGIRHGGISFVNAPEEDARYMLVSCSAFVNYLKDKYLKSQNGGNP